MHCALVIPTYSILREFSDREVGKYSQFVIILRNLTQYNYCGIIIMGCKLLHAVYLVAVDHRYL